MILLFANFQSIQRKVATKIKDWNISMGTIGEKTINMKASKRVNHLRTHLNCRQLLSVLQRKDIIAFESCYRRQTSSKSCALISVNRSSIKSRKTWNWISNRITLSGFFSLLKVWRNSTSMYSRFPLSKKRRFWQIRFFESVTNNPKKGS